MTSEAGYWERAYWAVVPVLLNALGAAGGEHVRHRYSLVPVWKADRSGIESWWWCTDHPAGQWVRIEDDPDAIASGAASLDELRAALEGVRTFARHETWCKFASTSTYPEPRSVDCDCGFDGALALFDRAIGLGPAG